MSSLLLTKHIFPGYGVVQVSMFGSTCVVHISASACSGGGVAGSG